MAPNNVTPNSTIWIVLVEEMIPTIIEQWTCYICFASIEILAKIKFWSPHFTIVLTFYMEMELIASIYITLNHTLGYKNAAYENIRYFNRKSGIHFF